MRVAPSDTWVLGGVVEWAAGIVEDLTHRNTTGDQVSAGRVDVLNNPEFAKKFPWSADFQKALETSKARPQTPNWTAIDTAIIDMSTAILSGQKQPSEAIKAASEQVAPYLKK